MVASVRALLTAAVLVALYYLLPLDNSGSDASVIVKLALGGVLFVGLMLWQLRAIAQSKNPGLRALEGLFLAIPLFLLLFAAAYYLMSRSDPSDFTAPLSRTDALYFTVTIFSTVGFGDISAKAEAARLVVTAQMFLDLVILGSACGSSSVPYNAAGTGSPPTPSASRRQRRHDSEWCTSHEDAALAPSLPSSADMSWIRNTQEAGDRRPIDIWRLGFCGLTVILLGVWAQSQSAINVDLFTPINGLGDDMVGLAKAVYALGLDLGRARGRRAAARRPAADARPARRAGRGRGMGYRAARQRARGHRTIRGARFDLRIGDGPAYPAVHVAIAHRDRVRALPRSPCVRCAASSGSS